MNNNKSSFPISPGEESPFNISPVEGGVQISLDVRTVKSERQTKKASFDKFEIICDEGLSLGGDNSAPPPLAYFAAAVAFWMLTQLSRSSEARKIELHDIAMTVTPRFEQTGSIGADTIQSRLIDVETSLNIDSPAPRDKIAKLVATAERMCFLMDTIREPHQVRNSVSLNGEAL